MFIYISQKKVHLKVTKSACWFCFWSKRKACTVPTCTSTAVNRPTGRNNWLSSSLSSSSLACNRSMLADLCGCVTASDSSLPAAWKTCRDCHGYRWRAHGCAAVNRVNIYQSARDADRPACQGSLAAEDAHTATDNKRREAIVSFKAGARTLEAQ